MIESNSADIIMDVPVNNMKNEHHETIEVKRFLQLLLKRNIQRPLSMTENEWHTNHDPMLDKILWMTPSSSSSSNSQNYVVMLESMKILQSQFDSCKWGTGIKIDEAFIIENMLIDSTDKDMIKTTYDLNLETMQLVGICRLVTLLLHKGVEITSSQNNKENNKSLNPNMIINTAGTLINNLTKKLCDAMKSVQQSTNHNGFINQLSQSYLSILTASIDNLSCKTKVLANVWRSICDITIALKRVRRQRIEKETLSYIVKRLIQYLDEGKGFLVNIVSNLKLVLLGQNKNMTYEDVINDTALQQMTKLYKFFLLRLHQIISITADERTLEFLDKNRRVLDHFLQFKGLAIMIYILSEQLGSAQKNNEWKRQLQPLLQIIPKIDQGVERLFFMTSSSSPSKQNNVINKINVGLCVATNNDESKDQNLIDSFWLGKLSALTSLLKLTLIPSVDDLGVSQGWYDIHGDLILSICDHLLLSVLPKCHGWLSVQIIPTSSTDRNFESIMSANLIEELLHVIVDCTLLLDSLQYSDKKCKSRIAFKFIQWLSPPMNRRTDIMETPLTKELVMLIVHHHIIMSSIVDEHKNPHHLIRYLGKFLFDPRTETILRSNICTLFIGLFTVCHSLDNIECKQKQSLLNILEKAEGFLCNEFKKFFKGVLGRSREVKADRNHSCYQDNPTTCVLFHGFEFIIPLVALLSTREVFWSINDQQLVDIFLRLIPQIDCGGDKKNQLKIKLMDEQPQLFYLAFIVLRGLLLSDHDLSSSVSINYLQKNVIGGIAQLCAHLQGDNVHSILFECLDTMLQMSTKGFSSNMWQTFLTVLSYGSDKNSVSTRTRFFIARLLSSISAAITGDVPEQVLKVRIYFDHGVTANDKRKYLRHDAVEIIYSAYRNALCLLSIHLKKVSKSFLCLEWNDSLHHYM